MHKDKDGSEEMRLSERARARLQLREYNTDVLSE